MIRAGLVLLGQLIWCGTAFAQQDQFFASNSVRLRDVEQGSGEAIILAHGLNGQIESSWIETRVLEGLSKDHRVIAFDPRGHGRSAKPHAPSAYGQEMALDIVRLMDHLGIRRAHVVGYSMGAVALAKLLTLHPGRILTATLGGATGRRPGTAEDRAAAEADAIDFERGIAFRSALLRTWPADQPAPTDGQLRSASQRLAGNVDLLALAAFTRGREGLAVTDTELQDVRVPVLAIAGSLDPEAVSVKRLQAIRPATRIVIVDGAVHSGGDPRGVVRRPEFVEAVRAFVRDAASQNGSTAAEESRCTAAALARVPPPESGTALVLDSVAPVPRAGEAVAFCRVRAHIHTANAHADAETDREIRIELRLSENWNRKYLQYGGGGTDGSIERAAIPLSVFGADRPTGDVLTRGYAIAATDGGHTGNGIEMGWLRNADGSPHQHRHRNYAFRARHLLAVAAKDILGAFYGGPPVRSYHGGISNGGRAGLIAAQRYPDDFDGIIVHSPAGLQAGQVDANLRTMKAQYPTDAKTPVLPAAGAASLLPLLARITMTRCDPADGITDGIISDPAACNFNVVRDLPLCRPGAAARSCFTPAQLSVLETVYTASEHYPRFLPNYQADPVAGMALRMFGPAGAAAAGYPSQMYGFVEETLKHWAFNDPTRTIQRAGLGDLSPERWASPFDRAEYLADSPDLSAFGTRGGRLLITHGLADPLVSPLATEDYYKRVIEAAGGIGPTIEFARLFLVPGQGHNTPVVAGVPSNFDWLTVLERWAEEKTAPEFLLGTAPGMTRPICRYPLKAALIDPEGTVRDAANFRCR